MIELLGSIVGFAFDMVSLAFTLAFDAVEFVFGLLGGLLSLLMSLGGFVLVIVLAATFIKRRKARKQARPQHIYVDEDGEEFTSYYHQEQR